jgi:hypothetical protein
MEKLTYKDVIEITKERYSNNTKLRSLDADKKCFYFHENGNKCAVGHFLKEGTNIGLMNGDEINNILLSEDDFKYYMVDNVQHLQDINFWDDLQFFHDTDIFWDENGITEKGLQYYTNLLNNYAKQDI